MKQIEVFESQVNICEIHTQRLETALRHVEHLLPFDVQKIKNFHLYTGDIQ